MFIKPALNPNHGLLAERFAGSYNILTVRWNQLAYFAITVGNGRYAGPSDGAHERGE
jgi:hypothetical protein